MTFKTCPMKHALSTTRSRPARALLVVCSLLAACVEKSPAPLQEAPAVDIDLGEARSGEHEWISANARYVALALELDGFGAERILFDTVHHRREGYDRIHALDRRGRFAVVRAGAHLWLLDAETDRRQDLASPAMDDAVEVEFDPWSERLFVRERPDRLVVRRLFADDARLLVAPFPVAHLDAGWAPGFLLVLDDLRSGENGRRALVAVDEPALVLPHTDVGKHVLAVGEAWSWEAVYPVGPHRPDDWYDRVGHRHALPAGCRVKSHPTGEVLLACDRERTFRWTPAGLFSLPRYVDTYEYAVRGADGERWQSALVDAPEARRLGRVSLEDQRIHVGPRIAYGYSLDRNRRGWMFASGETGLVAYDITTGRVRQLVGAVLDEPGLARAREGEPRYHALDLEGDRHVVLAREAEAVAENGCALMAPARGSAWSLRCPERRALRLDPVF